MSSQERLLPDVLAALGLEDGPEARAILRGSEAETSMLAAPEAAAAAASADDPADDLGATSADEMTCSICLQQTELEEIASVKDCEHTYCVKCILRWAAHRENPTCPQCKAPFGSLLTYYRLDGSLNDFPCEESVCLLKRAHFFTEHMQTVENGRCRLSAEDGGGGWADYEQYYQGAVGTELLFDRPNLTCTSMFTNQEYDDDEEVEAYYFSAAAGRARVTLGNRRWGENGYVASGHQRARPTGHAAGKKKGGTPSGKPAEDPGGSASTPAASSKGGRRRRKPAQSAPASAAAAGATGSGSGADRSSGGGTAAASSPIPMRRLSAAQPSGGESDGPLYGNDPLGSSPSSYVAGTGRRAKRNQRRATEDALAAL